MKLKKLFSLHNSSKCFPISHITTKALIISLLLTAGLLTGCNRANDISGIVLTTGFAKDEVFKLEDRSCHLPELMLYLVNIQNRYESVYGGEIWNTVSGGVKLSDSVKENALAQISQIKAMNILASDNGITLSDTEKEKVAEAASDYFAGLSSYEIEKLALSEDLIYDMYSEYAIANKYYREIIKDIDMEISDDEARTITVGHIFIKTYDTAPDGSRIEFTADEKQKAYEKAQLIHSLATDGEHDFEDLLLEYSDGNQPTYSFSKGDTDKTFEDAAFNLGNGEISDVISTINGYHIIKCINTFNREETDLNKIKISELARQDVFGENYDAYVSTLTTILNEPLWESVEVVHDDEINTQSFFEVYNKYLD